MIKIWLTITAVVFSAQLSWAQCLSNKDQFSLNMVDFNSSLLELKELFGKPELAVFEQPPKGDTTITVFGLKKEKRKGKKNFKFKYPKLIVTSLSTEILTLQLIGYSCKEDLNFCSLTLGTNKQEMIDKLGEPESFQDANELDGVSYQYLKGQISILVGDDEIRSIRIRKYAM